MKVICTLYIQKALVTQFKHENFNTYEVYESKSVSITSRVVVMLNRLFTLVEMGV